MAGFRPLKKRLMEKVVVDDKGCWVWQGSVFKKKSGSYGQIRMFGRIGKLKRAHRVSYEYFYGKIPKDKEIDHLCGNTLCINPDHLEPVNHGTNMRRAKCTTKTHCVNGHERTKDNIYINPKGAKECRICIKLSREKYNNKKRIDTT